ncbi:hypothetical protein COCMIDRAFT_94099 [Bipolaris oryzae ATCC 44560]|uniref:Uncharacterized protein n=1 Tax=Bipolaris oryzae ATCC 44560 TaxID=930090 RepID=W6Z840_COCMI|nr:uncharacterized protein COCMIDRAFT_94099 [Bipolaris oryzae ATCC 44560]EUC45943.1 hypothetical protein COCMIDRAFT_94099 [Bipolaris oryzae ATCC 44560]
MKRVYRLERSEREAKKECVKRLINSELLLPSSPISTLWPLYTCALQEALKIVRECLSTKAWCWPGCTNPDI